MMIIPRRVNACDARCAFTCSAVNAAPTSTHSNKTSILPTYVLAAAAAAAAELDVAGAGAGADSPSAVPTVPQTRQ